MVDLGEAVAGMAEMLSELVPGILDSLLDIGISNSHNESRRSRHDPIRLNLALQNREPDQKIVELNRPINAPMK
jgi:hypothetical protein